MWLRGYAESEVSFTPLSIAHQDDTNLLSISDGVRLFGVEVLPTPPCPAFGWCHLAMAVDLTAYPAYGAWTYVNGQSVGNVTGVFTKGLTPADIEEEALAFVVGQGQRRYYWASPGVALPLWKQDTMLGTFDPTQTFSGLLDEFRLWNTRLLLQGSQYPLPGARLQQIDAHRHVPPSCSSAFR
eukprot:EG_transcript_21801